MITDGITLIKQRLKTLSSSPGVYRMLNEAGDVLYVGKAKNLIRRVTSYTQPERMGARIRKMVFETRDLIVVETTTEAEALLLEANLIKSLKPKYNIIFRDDASYISVLITDEPAPMIRHHRGARKQKGNYFGPYPSADAVYQTLDLLERVFRLRTCKPSVFKNRSRPCLKYDIKRCSAPCVGKISPEDYAQSVAEAKLFLKGESKTIKKNIAQRMEAASGNEDYETAASERDKLKALEAITGQKSNITHHNILDADVFALAMEGGKACVQAFYYRSGRHVGNKTYFPKLEEDVSADELMRLFLAQYYSARHIPKLILTDPLPADNEALMQAFVKEEQGGKVIISSPSRGDKHKILGHAARNALEALKRKTMENENWRSQLAALAELIELPPEDPVLRIEAFDISNISGKQAVASMVVAGAEDMLKREYRKFAIKGKDSPDDYAMMREVLTRRYKRVLKESSENASAAWPNVVLVDGGKGHLGILVEVMHEVGMLAHPNCPALCAIAKGEERDKGLESIFLWDIGRNEVRQLPIPFNTPLIFVLQRIRDEAHRFAIGFHRQKRSKQLVGSALDDIPGVGPKKKKALLLHFGSLAAVKGANIDELMRAEGISKAIAEDIVAWFKT